MKLNRILIFYWTAFIISILTIILNFGLILLISSLLLLPFLILHGYIGIKIKNVKNNNILILASGINLLLFSLVRIDGVHSSTNSGFSALMKFLGFYYKFNLDDDEIYFYGSILLFFFQIIIDITLVNRISTKANSNVHG